MAWFPDLGPLRDVAPRQGKGNARVLPRAAEKTENDQEAKNGTHHTSDVTAPPSRTEDEQSDAGGGSVPGYVVFEPTFQ